MFMIPSMLYTLPLWSAYDGMLIYVRRACTGVGHVDIQGLCGIAGRLE